MATKKKVIFNYYTARKDYGENAENRFEYLTEVTDLLTDLAKKDKKDIVYNMQDGRIMWLDEFNKKSDTVWYGHFGSAIKGDRPNVVNVISLKEKKNPIAKDETAKADTFFSIMKEDNDSPEVHMFIQYNHRGVSSTKIGSYIQHFLTKRLTEGDTLGYTVDIQPILKSDFLADARKMKRVSTVKVHYEKSICDGTTQIIAGNTEEMSDDVVFTTSAKRGKTILPFLESVYERFKKTNGESKINKITVVGYDADNAKSPISTDDYIKRKVYDVDYDTLTRILDKECMDSCVIGMANGY